MIFSFFFRVFVLVVCELDHFEVRDVCMCVSVGSFAVVDGDIFLSHGGMRGVAPRLCLDRG